MKEMTVTLKDRQVLKRGSSDYGAWTLYGFSGTNEQGTSLDRLKSFQALPLGVPIRVEAEESDHPKYGVSYMLKASDPVTASHGHAGEPDPMAQFGHDVATVAHDTPVSRESATDSRFPSAETRLLDLERRVAELEKRPLDLAWRSLDEH